MTLIALMALLQLADVYTTHRFIAHGKRELNPVIRLGMVHIGFWPTMAVKVALAMGATIGPALMGLPWVIAILCAVYAAVVVNNWRLV